MVNLGGQRTLAAGEGYGSFGADRGEDLKSAKRDELVKQHGYKAFGYFE